MVAAVAGKVGDDLHAYDGISSTGWIIITRAVLEAALLPTEPTS